MASVPIPGQLPLFPLDKRCRTCGETKPLAAFGRHPHMRDGRQSYCKACDCARKKAEYRRDPEGVNAKRRERRLRNPEVYRATLRRSQERHRERRREDARRWHLDHLEERRQKDREYYRANRAACRASRRRYYRLNRERWLDYLREWRAGRGQEVLRSYRNSPQGKVTQARANLKRRMANRSVPHTLTGEQWQAILDMQGRACHYCGQPFTDARRPTMDHVVPVSKGGGTTKENIVAACRSCNSRKGNRT